MLGDAKFRQFGLKFPSAKINDAIRGPKLPRIGIPALALIAVWVLRFREVKSSLDSVIALAPHSPLCLFFSFRGDAVLIPEKFPRQSVPGTGGVLHQLMNTASL